MATPATTELPPGKIRRGCVIVDANKRWKPGKKPDPNARRQQPKVGRMGPTLLMEHKPEAVVSMVANAKQHLGSNNATADFLGIAPSTVEGILSRNPEDTATAEKHLSRRFLALADRALTHSGNNLDSLNAYQAMLVAGISVDKHVALVTKGNPSVAIQINIAAALGAAQRNLEVLTGQIEQPTPEQAPTLPVAVDGANNQVSNAES